MTVYFLRVCFNTAVQAGDWNVKGMLSKPDPRNICSV